VHGREEKPHPSVWPRLAHGSLHLSGSGVMDLEDAGAPEKHFAFATAHDGSHPHPPRREDVELIERLIRKPRSSIFGFRSMLVRQPEFLIRMEKMVNEKFNIRTEPAGSRQRTPPPQPPLPSVSVSCLSSNHAYDPLRYTGVRPYPDSRGPPEFDPTPDIHGRDQCQLYATAYYYDAKSMLKQACRMRTGKERKLPESVLTALESCRDPDKPAKPIEADGSTDGFRRFDDEREFERMVTRRLFPFVCQKDWQITKGFRNKLLQLNNTFYDLRQEGIILAVDCGLEGGGDSGGGGGDGNVLLTEEEKEQVSRELDEDFRKIEQGEAY